MSSPIGEQGDETFIVGEGAQGIPQGQVGVAVWKGSRGDVDGQFRDGAYGSRLDSSRIGLPSRIIRPEALGGELDQRGIEQENGREPGMVRRSLETGLVLRPPFDDGNRRFLREWLSGVRRHWIGSG
jgi:hypothetical protein